jgi:hypothetical protein
MSSEQHDRVIRIVTDPRGQQYRVVTAPHGVWLREWSAATDVPTLIIEIFIRLLPWPGRHRSEFKLGVFAVKPFGYERCLHKLTHISAPEIEPTATKICGEIEAGSFPATSTR